MQENQDDQDDQDAMKPETAKVVSQASFVSSPDHEVLGRPWRRGGEACTPCPPHQLCPRLSLTSWPRHQEPACPQTSSQDKVGGLRKFVNALCVTL